MIRGLEVQGGDYSRLTAVQKQKATKALKHNRFDVEAIARLWDFIAKHCGTSVEMIMATYAKFHPTQMKEWFS